jgi:signal transduction histidine kinase/DNA-binding response OmpR family regulator
MMPRRDGFSLLREIRQTPESRTTAVILLSARAGEESRLEGLASGADDYLVKPFSARELLARVEAHVRLKRLRERAEEERQALLTREQAARQEAARTSELVETITRIAGRLAAQTDLGTLLQSFTDEATRLAGAQVGAFFHNAVDDRGPAYRVAALSGAPREAFEGLPPPRATRLFRPTFRGERIVRLDDVTESPDYGETPPHRGVPDGHLPVRSYLAVPVVSRMGEVFGAFFLGHERPRVFPERLEPIMAGIAAQLAIAVENVRLLDREQRARAAAEAASRAKDEFLAVLSHELRTPLNAVYGWAGLLQSGRLDAAATARALAAIMRNAHAQVQLIDDMLDVSRIVTGKMRLLSRPVDVTAVAEAALDAVRPAADARGLELHAALPARGVQVRGDPDRLQQVVWNLLSNAVKFTPAGGRVELAVRRVGGQLEIAVGDTGQGIAPDVLPHVFERFQQADSTPSRRHGGLGLGLALVRHLVELHGGQVAAASAGPGRGATFTVTLPLLAGPAAEAPPPPRAAAPPPAPPPAGGPSLSGVRVLVVDDDADGLELVTAILGHAGAETRSCRSMSAAMATLDAWRPDVVVSDIEMPGEDGYALVRALRARPAERGGRTPAVALTAYGRMEDRLRALSAGYSRHVAKPVDPAELLTLVASLAGR